MMTAKDILSRRISISQEQAQRAVSADMPVLEVIPRLLDSPKRILRVKSGRDVVGIIDESSLLEGIGRMIAPRDDCSILTVECAPYDYSASRIAHAVEDSDAHLVDMWSVPAEDGHLRVTLRVRRSDPTPTVHSLERYGYDVVEVHGSDYGDGELAATRLLELQTLLNV